MIALAIATHSSQIMSLRPRNDPGLATSFATWSSRFRQNEHFSLRVRMTHRLPLRPSKLYRTSASRAICTGAPAMLKRMKYSPEPSRAPLSLRPSQE